MKIIEYREGQGLPRGSNTTGSGEAFVSTPLGIVYLKDRDLLIYDEHDQPQVARWQRPDTIRAYEVETTSIRTIKDGIQVSLVNNDTRRVGEVWQRREDGKWDYCRKQWDASGDIVSEVNAIETDAPWPTLPCPQSHDVSVGGCACKSEHIAQRVIDEICKQAQRDTPFSDRQNARQPLRF